MYHHALEKCAEHSEVLGRGDDTCMSLSPLVNQGEGVIRLICLVRGDTTIDEPWGLGFKISKTRKTFTHFQINFTLLCHSFLNRA